MTKTYISPQNKIGYLFIFLTTFIVLGLIFGVFKTAYGTQIIVTPKLKELDVNFQVTVQENNSLDLNGKIIEKIIEKEQTFSAQATVSMEDYAEGEIILTNNTWSPINFVSGTRFASPEGLIFRAIDRIYIPAQGNTTIIVRADKMGPDYEIEPTQFTIPNLKNEHLKENIIAESENPMSGGLKKTGVVMQSDIDEALEEIKETAYQEGIEKIKEDLSNQNFKIIVNPETVEESVNAVAGEEKAEFNVLEKIKITAVAIQEDELLELALEKIKENIPAGQKLIAYQPKNLSYRIKEVIFEQEKAILEVQFKGYTIINEENKILEKQNFLGLTEKEIQEYFKDSEKIEEVKVKFWPPFILKKIPQSENRLKIKINY